jgi:hypothetical protein
VFFEKQAANFLKEFDFFHKSRKVFIELEELTEMTEMDTR